MIDRRTMLSGAALGAVGLAIAPILVHAKAATARRFVFIIQRGAADGLGMVAPVADPAYASARGSLIETGGTKLDGMFELHPMLGETVKLYAAGEALFVHAVASPYRDRSHLDGQNVLETGGAAPYRVKDGWMNRLLGLLPAEEAHAIAVAPTVPMALRGGERVASYAPSALPGASQDLLARVGALYESDKLLHSLWEQALATREMAGDLAEGRGRDAAATGALAARLLAPEDGARLAMIETGGWDTHARQKGRLSRQLRGLDAMIASLKDGLGGAWADTLVLVATEFGRTVAINGTGGTDHGTASAAMLLGGAAKGGRVLADWPGLRDADLYEGRDLKPTLSLDLLIASALADYYSLDPELTLRALFPAAAKARPIEGLIRA